MLHTFVKFFTSNDGGGKSSTLTTSETTPNLNTQKPNTPQPNQDTQNEPKPRKSQKKPSEIDIEKVWTKEYKEYLLQETIKGSTQQKQVRHGEWEEVGGKYPSIYEVELLEEHSKRLKLNPKRDEIYLLSQHGKTQIFIGREGYRIIMKRQPEYDHHVARCVYEGDTFEEQDGKYIYKTATQNRGRLLFAFCAIMLKGTDRYIINTVPVEFVEKARPHMKDVMLVKDAECAGARHVFPEVFAGTYSEWEMWDMPKTEKVHTPPPQNSSYTQEEVNEWKKKIQDTKSEDELKAVWLEYYKQHTKKPFNTIQDTEIIEAKEEKKAVFEQQEKEQNPKEDANIFDVCRETIKLAETQEELEAVREEWRLLEVSESQRVVLESLLKQREEEMKQPKEEPEITEERMKAVQDERHLKLTQAIQKIQSIDELDTVYKNIDAYEKEGTLRTYQIDTLKKAMEAKKTKLAE